MLISLRISSLMLASLSACNPVYAQTDQMGHLLSSPAQRQLLNTLREQYQRSLYAQAGSGLDSYTFNGLVSQHGKPQALWVNGNLAAPAKLGAHQRGSYQLQLPTGAVLLKPGQTYPARNATDVLDIAGEHAK